MTAPACWRRSALAAALSAAAWATALPAAHAQRRDTIPSQAYYLGVEQLYEGEYRNAERAFIRGLRSAVKTLGPDGTILWVDSICYHAMLGETYFQWGQPKQALEQFNYACGLYLEYPRWMLRVEFTADPRANTALARVAIPWGASQRQSTPAGFPTTMRVAQGQINNSQQVRQGGVVLQPQYWPVNVVEVVRCTALAIRRRNELLGPLGPFDPISRDLVLALSRGGAPPNHWSNAWIDVQRGLAHAGVGELDQAVEYLSRGTLIGGQFDHPLTGVALLEQGRLALNSQNAEAASRLLAEASYSGLIYEDASIIDDAFRWLELSRIASGAGGINPALEPAIAWTRRERLDHLASRLQLALADELMSAGDVKGAAVASAAAQASLGDARTGVLGNSAAFVAAKLEYEQQRPSAPEHLESAINGQRAISLQNFQIGKANEMFDQQSLPSRSAAPVYDALLSDPTPTDAMLRPLESMAVMSTRHDDAFDRWLLAVLERRNLNAAVEVVDHAKRRRFHYALPWGGRLSAVRMLLCAPETSLTPGRRQQRSGLLTRFPEFADSLAHLRRVRDDLHETWRPAPDDEQRRKLARLWEQYQQGFDAREMQLGRIALARVPSELPFPPRLEVTELQSRLRPGQAVLVYHDTPAGLLGFLFTSQAASHWNCGPSGRISTLISQMLREMGNVDGNREIPVETLASDAWRQSSDRLYAALFEGSSMAASALTELVVIPDGVTWYVPFEALVAEGEGRSEPLISFAKIRYAPTVGLAFSFDGAWRRVQRTGVVAGKLAPGDAAEARAESLGPLQAALENPLVLEPPLPAASPVVGSLLDGLVVMDEVETQGADPLAWSPLPLDRAQQAGSLRQWLTLPGDGPQRVLLPGMHTPAERGGKAPPRRRGPDAAMPGSELFYASCGLMSAGAETVLLTRWRVGGQSTLDLVREFAQELPHTAAADAWQRSVQLEMQSNVDPTNEPRVAAGKTPVELKAAHPFFWAGYLVVDSGWRPEEDEEAADQPAPAQAGAAPAVKLPPQQPKALAPAEPGGKAADKTPPPKPTPKPTPTEGKGKNASK